MSLLPWHWAHGFWLWPSWEKWDGVSIQRVWAELRHLSRQTASSVDLENPLSPESSHGPLRAPNTSWPPLSLTALGHSPDPLCHPSLCSGILTPTCWPCSSTGMGTTRKWAQLSLAAALSLSLRSTPCASSPGQAKCKSWWPRRVWANHCCGAQFSPLDCEAVDEISHMAANLHPSNRSMSPPSPSAILCRSSMYQTVRHGTALGLQASLDFSGSTSGKEPTCQCRWRGFDFWVRKIPWRSTWQPTPVFLPGESHGHRNLVGYRP